MLELIGVNSNNRHFVNKLKGKLEQLHLVHYNAYWYGQSCLQDDIHFLLAKSTTDYVGVICFGQYYKDAYLEEKELGIGEIIHIVVDGFYQGQGYSKKMAEIAIARLKKEGYLKIYVAINAENMISINLWQKLGFQLTNNRNYDGDIIYEWVF